MPDIFEALNFAHIVQSNQIFFFLSFEYDYLCAFSYFSVLICYDDCKKSSYVTTQHISLSSI